MLEKILFMSLTTLRENRNLLRIPPVANKHIGVGGPSGSGKTTIIRSDEQSILRIKPKSYSSAVSAATRTPRENEVNGEDYFFMNSRNDFEKCLYLETNEYEGNSKLYGTLYSEAERIIIRENKSMLLDVDINGLMRLTEIFKLELYSVFLRTPLDMLYGRLKKRSIITGETEEQIQGRLRAAEEEYRKIDQKIFIPNLVIEYPDSMRPAEIVNEILLKAAMHK